MVNEVSLVNGPSKNLSWKELACKDGHGYPQAFVEDGRIYRLAQVFENIRKLAGNVPIKVHSAYRTVEYNKKIGGVANSQHIQGLALDLEHTKMANDNFFRLLYNNWEALGIRGIGHYKTFVHIDIRDSERLVPWSN